MSTPPPSSSPSPTGPNRAERPIDAQVRKLASAYPGTTTYLDLMRKNRRQSFWLVVLMIALGVIVGAIMGASVGLVTVSVWSSSSSADAQHAPPVWHTSTLLVPSMIGAGIALVIASLGAAWSWFDGANAILGMLHATPLDRTLDPELYNVVDEMRIAAGMPMPRIYLIPETALNAFATGRDPEHGVVAITTALRAKLTREELQAVIAHEMAHIRHLDIRFSMLMATMVGLIVFACDAFVRIAWTGLRASGTRGRSSRSGKGEGGAVAIFIILLIIAAILAVVAPLFAKLIQMAYSREREYLADAGAVELTRNPQALASALRKLADDEEPLVDLANRGTAHMFIVNPLRKMRAKHQELNSPFASHPPLPSRIARIMALLR
ncbi:MAG: M48 family metallopeptidase [Phycisphaeraceae bacterium]|nr:M48 family metallopeptidase [Phycisphaeraceae bacterium]